MIVISNGMLRSGSTLQYNVAACLLETAYPLKRAGFLGAFDKPEVRAKLEALKASDDWAILKTHEAPLERTFYDERVRVLFSYRDVRDIAASIRKKWGYPFEKILAEIDAMLEIERRFADIPNVLVQSYDTLYNNLPEATHKIAQFLDVTVDDFIITRISIEYSLNGHSAISTRNSSLIRRLVDRLARRTYDSKTLLHPDHVSASGGRDGDWMNQFDNSEVSTLNKRFADWLQRHGYQLFSESAL